jgi:P2-related tail formation protein
MTESLIPPSIADDRCLALGQLLDRQGDLPVSAVLGSLYDPANAPAVALDYLAHQLGVMGPSWTMAGTDDSQRRALLANALYLQRLRGTPWAIRNALAAVGWPQVTLTPRSSGWASFVLNCPLVNEAVGPADVALLESTALTWAPVRDVLDYINFELAFTTPITLQTGYYDGTETYSGATCYEGGTLSEIATIGVAGGDIGFYDGQSHFDGSLLFGGAASPGNPSSFVLPIPAGGVNLSTPHLAVISFMVPPGQCNGTDLDTFVVYTQAGVPLAQVSFPPIAKTTQDAITCVWTLTY